jgi:hypothetical protein
MIVPNGPDTEWSAVLGMGAKDQHAPREFRAGNDRAERESSRARRHYLLGAQEIEGAISDSWSKQPSRRK